jgi:hypothetical protein
VEIVTKQTRVAAQAKVMKQGAREMRQEASRRRKARAAAGAADTSVVAVESVAADVEGVVEGGAKPFIFSQATTYGRGASRGSQAGLPHDLSVHTEHLRVATKYFCNPNAKSGPSERNIRELDEELAIRNGLSAAQQRSANPSTSQVTPPSILPSNVTFLNY